MKEKKKYYLCFKGTNKKGKEEVYPILKADINTIDMYTCFCSDKKDLIQKMPCGNKKRVFGGVIETPMVRPFIEDTFDLEKEYDFYIVEDNGKNPRNTRIKEPVMYSDNRDVVYINKDKDKRELLDILIGLKMSIEECNYAQLKSFDDNKYKHARIKYNFFREIIEELGKRNAKILDMFDENANEFTSTRVMALATSLSNLIILEKEANRDPILKRNLCLKIKDVIKEIDDLNEVKTRLISKEESLERQKNREKLNSNFSIGKIMQNESNLLYEEKKYINKKYGEKEEVKKKNSSEFATYEEFLEEKGIKYSDEDNLTPTEKYEEAIKKGTEDDFFAEHDLDDVDMGYVDLDEFKNKNGRIK